MKSETADKELLQYKTKDKDFDCVKMMRVIRTRLFKRYSGHPALMKKEIENAGKKYGFSK
jgi:hypothetical protein